MSLKNLQAEMLCRGSHTGSDHSHKFRFIFVFPAGWLLEFLIHFFPHVFNKG